ncbi:MAG: class D sortase [Eubacterium sp.]|nr:class D sortase [Eubacterium sp.]
MSKKRLSIIAVLTIFIGLSIFLYPIFLRFYGEKNAKQLMEDFKENVDEETPTEEISSEQATTTEALPDALLEEGVIGIIKIESIGIEYPILEGADDSVLNIGIGHLTETAAIGAKGNAVLCGHNGSRRGIFFTPLNTVSIGDKVEIMDKMGVIHNYKIVNTRIVGPRDNSIKNTDGTEKLTLFTCANRGTERFVCDCLPLED